MNEHLDLAGHRWTNWGATDRCWRTHPNDTDTLEIARAAGPAGDWSWTWLRYLTPLQPYRPDGQDPTGPRAVMADYHGRADSQQAAAYAALAFAPPVATLEYGAGRIDWLELPGQHGAHWVAALGDDRAEIRPCPIELGRWLWERESRVLAPLSGLLSVGELREFKGSADSPTAAMVAAIEAQAAFIRACAAIAARLTWSAD